MFISVLQTALQSLIFFALHFKSNGSFPRQLSAKEERECLEKAAQGDLAARDGEPTGAMPGRYVAR